MRYLKLHDVCGALNIEEELLHLLLDEGLVTVKHSLDDETVISIEEAERLRVALLLMRELDVNLAGVEVILHMRDDLLATQRQFEEILHALAEELRKRIE